MPPPDQIDDVMKGSRCASTIARTRTITYGTTAKITGIASISVTGIERIVAIRDSTARSSARTGTGATRKANSHQTLALLHRAPCAMSSLLPEATGGVAASRPANTRSDALKETDSRPVQLGTPPVLTYA